MPNDSSRPALLKVLHSDILLPGESEDSVLASSTSDSVIIPPTRTEDASQYSLTEEICTIGRSLDSTIRVHRYRTDVSRLHATIRREGSRYRLYDHSTRGTFINDHRVDSYLLNSGDVLGFAESPRMLRFLDPAHRGIALTARETDILRCIMRGQTNKRIAAELSISRETVNTHVQHIYEKLGVHSRTEAVAVAHVKGLFDEAARR